MSKERCVIQIDHLGNVRIKGTPQRPLNLDEIQGMVGGYIETVPTKLGDDIVMVIDEEGKLKGKAYNYLASSIYLNGGPDPIVGSGILLQRVADELLGVEKERVFGILDRIGELSGSGKHYSKALLFKPADRKIDAKDLMQVYDMTAQKTVALIFRVGFATNHNLIESYSSIRIGTNEIPDEDRYIVVTEEMIDAHINGQKNQRSRLFDTLEAAKNWAAGYFSEQITKGACE